MRFSVWVARTNRGVTDTAAASRPEDPVKRCTGGLRKCRNHNAALGRWPQLLHADATDGLRNPQDWQVHPETERDGSGTKSRFLPQFRHSLELAGLKDPHMSQTNSSRALGACDRASVGVDCSSVTVSENRAATCASCAEVVRRTARPAAKPTGPAARLRSPAPTYRALSACAHARFASSLVRCPEVDGEPARAIKALVSVHSHPQSNSEIEATVVTKASKPRLRATPGDSSHVCRRVVGRPSTPAATHSRRSMENVTTNPAPATTIVGTGRHHPVPKLSASNKSNAEPAELPRARTTSPSGEELTSEPSASALANARHSQAARTGMTESSASTPAIRKTSPRISVTTLVTTQTGSCATRRRSTGVGKCVRRPRAHAAARSRTPCTKSAAARIRKAARSNARAAWASSALDR